MQKLGAPSQCDSRGEYIAKNQSGTPSEPLEPLSSPSTGVGLLEKPEEKTLKDPGDGDRFAHFVRKDRIDHSLITGQPVVALCGKVWVPTRDASRYPVCPQCKALRDGMGKNGKNWPFSDGSGHGEGGSDQ